MSHLPWGIKKLPVPTAADTLTLQWLAGPQLLAPGINTALQHDCTGGELHHGPKSLIQD